VLVSSQPSPVGVAMPAGAATAAQRKSPSPNSSACASSSKSEATWSAWPAARHMHQAVDGQPRASAITTRQNVGRSNS